jgi:hypothetical protein
VVWRLVKVESVCRHRGAPRFLLAVWARVRSCSLTAAGCSNMQRWPAFGSTTIWARGPKSAGEGFGVLGWGEPVALADDDEGGDVFHQVECGDGVVSDQGSAEC